jgi:lipoprotein-anchoring transpeptidase ErfK/SrfK
VWIAVVLAVVLVAAGLTAWMLRPAGEPASAPVITPTPTVTPTPTPTLTPTPTPAGFPANTAAYDVTSRPQVNVSAVIPDLPIDDDAFGTFTGDEAVARGIGAPVFADPLGKPVAYLPSEFPYDGTTVPVVERQDHWVKVLLTGRHAVPSRGDSAQVAGWLRMQDVELSASDVYVDVSISHRAIDIVRNGVRERIANDFAWGRPDTPTPLGRAFIMTRAVAPEFAYTRGHPIIYLSVQSPTLDGFNGADVAITAFHYHDWHSGQISNGCIRLTPEPIAKLAGLPFGTPVYIRP